MTCARQIGVARAGVTEEEIALYDALEVNDSAVQVLGDETLRTIAQELVRAVRSNVTIDWTLQENVRAKMRLLVKRILQRYGYPLDKQEKATQRAGAGGGVMYAGIGRQHGRTDNARDSAFPYLDDNPNGSWAACLLGISITESVELSGPPNDEDDVQ